MMQKCFVGIAKKISNIFLVNASEISIGPYLNEKLCWANQIFVDSTQYFSGCTVKYRLHVENRFKINVYWGEKMFR